MRRNRIRRRDGLLRRFAEDRCGEVASRCERRFDDLRREDDASICLPRASRRVRPRGVFLSDIQRVSHDERRNTGHVITPIRSRQRSRTVAGLGVT